MADTFAPTAGEDGRRRWPLLLIGASAGTATWSGWVGLGELTGFGVVHPLPGIWDDLTLNTAITLPIGVEAYAVYALAVATDARPLTRLARRWAWASAAGALLLGMGGQIAYHLLAARGVTTAPAWVVALVSSLPVLVLGAASLLWHLAAATPTDTTHAATATAAAPVPVSLTVVPDTAPSTATSAPVVTASARPAVAAQAPYSPARPVKGPAVSGAIASRTPGRSGGARSTVTATVVSPSDDEVLAHLDAQPAGEDLPSIRALMRDHGIGQARATRIHREATTRRARATSPVAGRGHRGGAAMPPPTGPTDDDPTTRRPDRQSRHEDDDPDTHREQNQTDRESQDSGHEQEHREDS
ncbi:hypothetical protein [Kineosporia sp. R_H_3]|uniref:hypothetical protein n=1 Tax=Kineosporia sp. R_H_3 TaxID=1961848 RepID=UPI000B4AFFA8|nr:hypothetical protein [Kineosporia sp. R_H_3]